MINILGSGNIRSKPSPRHAFSDFFPADRTAASRNWLGSAIVCVTVLIYVFGGGMRSLSFANGLHARVLVALGGVILFLVVGKLGGATAASQLRGRAASRTCSSRRAAEAAPIGHMEFLTYMFVPLSVGMFPHLFQHWMTAKDVKTFRPVVILHPFFIMLVWAPCILLGVWATFRGVRGQAGDRPANAVEVKNVLATMVAKLTNPVVAGFLGVGIVSATMSLDSQFLALTSMFTHDIIAEALGEKRFGDKQRILAGRLMVVAIVATAYILSLHAPRHGLPTGRLVLFGLLGAVSPRFRRALLAARDRRRRDRLDRRHLGRLGLLFRESGWGVNKDYLFHGMLPAAAIFCRRHCGADRRLAGDAAAARRKWSSGSSRGRKKKSRWQWRGSRPV